MNKENNKALTPLMAQYFDIKKRFNEALLFFQVGDFYELFFEDAIKASSFLGIALTKRGKVNGEVIPLCGVPMHASHHYIHKLIKGGFRVAVCNQVEEAKPGKIVERKVDQVLTPGTLTDSKLLDDKSASYLLSFFPMKEQWGFIFAEILTGQIFASLLPSDSFNILQSELIRFFPDEVLLPNNKLGKSFEFFFKKLGYFVTFSDYDINSSDEWLKNQFKSEILKNIYSKPSLKYSLDLFHFYLNRNQSNSLTQFKSFYLYDSNDFLILDPSTQKNLELIRNCQDGARKNTLFELLDYAATAMGSRMIKKWLLRPLIKEEIINQRLDIIDYFLKEIALRENLKRLLSNIGDLERIVGRIALNRANLNDYRMLLNALVILPEISFLLKTGKLTLLRLIRSKINDFSRLEKLLKASINDDLSNDWNIKKGFDQHLDHLRDLIENSNQKILELEQREQKNTGINSLKVRYNQVQGYYIEVTKSNLHLVPAHYKKHQTLSNKERFIIQELRNLQMEITTARNEILQVEKSIFNKVSEEVYSFLGNLRNLTHALASLDAFLGIATAAYENNYVRPTFNSRGDILIVNGRHPVLERKLQASFIANSTSLTDSESLWIITGPNMGGKSTYLRQTALICIMAQLGSFVPAEEADLSIIDRIFTRIGSADNLADGKSTFLVEMEETALICNQATKRSLVILDEVGRGTSTFDGMAIAQAVVEYIYTHLRSRCLFATHYHELSLLEDRFSGIQSYYASSKKTEKGILFLYKIVKGIADGSFGIEVAKLAGLPEPLIVRANKILSDLNKTSSQHNIIPASEHLCKENENLKRLVSELQEKLKISNNILNQLDDIDFDNLTPKSAFDILWDLKDVK